METSDTRKLRETLDLLGIRAQATAAGLVQIAIELHGAGVLDEAAVGRIKSSILGDLMLSCPASLDPSDYETTLRRRLDALFTGRARVSDKMSEIDKKAG